VIMLPLWKRLPDFETRAVSDGCRDATDMSGKRFRLARNRWVIPEAGAG
jgi:hypothetical protein